MNPIQVKILRKLHMKGPQFVTGYVRAKAIMRVLVSCGYVETKRIDNTLQYKITGKGADALQRAVEA